MSRFNKDLDHGLQKTQGTLCSGIYAVSLISDKLYDLKKSNPDDEMVSELLTISEDAAFLLSHASFLMSNSRREHLKHLFQGDYKELCKKSQEVTDELFGSELSKLVRISQRPHGQQPRCSKRTKLQLPFVHSLKIPFGHKTKIPLGRTKNSIFKNSQKTTDGTPTRQHQLRRKLRYQKTQ